MRRVPRILLVLLWILLSSSHVAAETMHTYLHTREVSALAIWQDGLWTATSGGIERYDLATLARTHHLTQEHGLDSTNVLSLSVGSAGLVARTPYSECLVTGQGVRCAPSTAELPAPRRGIGSLGGAPITQEVHAGERVLSATQGAGVWVRGQGQDLTRAQPVTPPNQVCTNHVQAMAPYAGALWLGGFRDGLCVRRAGAFERVSAPFRFVNAMLATSDALFVAANEGLFRTHDGQTFERVPLLAQAPERGVNGLASVKDTLWVTTPTALYRVPLAGGHVEALWTPGGSTAIQGLSVRADESQHGEAEVWLASEDRGAIRVRGKQVDVFDALRGLASSWVLDVVVDGKGTAYAATLRHGLFAIAPSGSVRNVALPSAWLLRLGFRDDALWVGTQDGLVTAVSRDGKARASQELALPGQCVHSALEFEGKLWVGTEAGTFAL